MNAFNTKGEQTSRPYSIRVPVGARVRQCNAWEEGVTRATYRAVPLLRGHSVIPHWYHAKNKAARCEREPPHPPPLYLGELINLLQSFLYLQASPVARDTIHHSHHRLLDQLPADEAFKDLGNLQTVFCIFSSELLHLKHRNVSHGPINTPSEQLTTLCWPSAKQSKVIVSNNMYNNLTVSISDCTACL